MANYSVLIDSNSDLTLEVFNTLDVTLIPTVFTIENKTYSNYPDQREYDFKLFYEKLRAGIPSSTSLINVEQYKDAFEVELVKGNDVLYISFSSGLSGLFNCSRLAKEDLSDKYPDRKIIVVDSLCACGGEGLLVYYAMQQKAKGLSIDELVKWVEENRDHVCHWFTVDDLDHLKRGGRLSSAAAFLGGMLNIKPVLHVNKDGKLVPSQKVRGRKASLDALVSEMVKTITKPDEQEIWVYHADHEVDCDYVVKQIKSKFKVKAIKKGMIGPVIGSHAGPGTIAVFFMGTEK